MTSILSILALSLLVTFTSQVQAQSKSNVERTTDLLRVHAKISNNKTEILSVEKVEQDKSAIFQSAKSDKVILRRLPYFIAEGKDYGADIYYEESLVRQSSSSPEILRAFKKSLLQARLLDESILQSEVRVLVDQGSPKNRINLTILGDGYTLAEKEKFFADAKRTTEGLFVGKTFASYLPLFNVYAVFVASNESGIGDGSPKNTAFKLYRDPAGSKRAIMPGSEAALERALRLAPATDYPIVLANDEFYGGLGGRYAISTSSERSGLIVLRHELGHNFGEVGEEYDNGAVYTGANATRNSANPPWKHWIDDTPQVFESKLLSGDYVWQNLRTSYSKNFSIPSGFDLLLVQISSVGWNSPEDVFVQLNGEKLEVSGIYHDDRSFFDSAIRSVTSGQSYRLDIQEKIKDGNNVLGFAVVHAYPQSYDFTKNRIAAFSTFSQSGSKFYRPSHDSCLMRNMLSENFCSVDKENMWLKFLARISLIDSLSVSSSGSGKVVTLQTQNLSELDIRWYLTTNGQETELIQFAQQKVIDASELTGQLKVKVTLVTPEVRLRSNHLVDQSAISL